MTLLPLLIFVVSVLLIVISAPKVWRNHQERKRKRAEAALRALTNSEEPSE